MYYYASKLGTELFTHTHIQRNTLQSRPSKMSGWDLLFLIIYTFVIMLYVFVCVCTWKKCSERIVAESHLCLVDIRWNHPMIPSQIGLYLFIAFSLIWSKTHFHFYSHLIVCSPDFFRMSCIFFCTHYKLHTREKKGKFLGIRRKIRRKIRMSQKKMITRLWYAFTIRIINNRKAYYFASTLFRVLLRNRK